jgi:nucleoprotein TPR
MFSPFFLLLISLKVRAENLKKEKEMLKLSEVRLSQQRESLLAEQRGQNLLLTNLRTIQVIK